MTVVFEQLVTTLFWWALALVSIVIATPIVILIGAVLYFFCVEVLRRADHRSAWVMLGALIGIGLLVGDLVAGRVLFWVLR